MPALPDVPAVIRIVLHYTVGADTLVINRFFIKYTGTPPDNSGLNSWSAAYSSAWNSNFAPLASSQVTLTNVTMTDLTSTTSAQGTNAASRVGSRAGAFLPAGDCVMLNFHIQRRYRGGKPRMYMPLGVATDLTNAQTWSTTFLNSVGGAFNAFLIGGNAGAPPGLSVAAQVSVSYYHLFENKEGSTGRAYAASTPRPTPLVDNISSATVNTRVASQRRRDRP